MERVSHASRALPLLSAAPFRHRCIPIRVPLNLRPLHGCGCNEHFTTGSTSIRVSTCLGNNAVKVKFRIRNSSASAEPVTKEAAEGAAEDSSVSGDAIRRRFLNFYASRGHKILPSSSLVPDDPTVFLTIAGMLQFKPIFLGKSVAHRNLDVRHALQLLNDAYAQMTLKTWDKRLDTTPFSRCLGTSALAITSKRKQLYGHGSFQLRSMNKTLFPMRHEVYIDMVYLLRGCGLVFLKMTMKPSFYGTMRLVFQKNE